MQFNSVKLFSQQRRSKLVPCWLAAMNNEKSFKKHYNSSAIKKINVAHTCEEIQKEIQSLRSEGKSERFIMYLSSQLMCGITRIHSYQVAYYQKEVFEIQIESDALKKKKSDKELPSHGGMIVPMDDLDYPIRELPLLGQNLLNRQLPVDRHLLSDENVKLQVTMHDANFGNVNYEDFEFLFGPDNNISDEMRMLQINEERDISEHMDNMTITEEIQEKQQSQEMLSPVIVDVTKIKDKSKGLSLTPQKRQQEVEMQVETPTKRRRLSFETAATIEPPVPVEDVTVPTVELQLPVETKTKGTIIDKKIKLTHKQLQKWRQDVNIHCRQSVVPSKYDKVERFLKLPSYLPMKRYLWNSSLHKLFVNHANTSVEEDDLPLELIQSQEVIRVEETNLNLPTELSIFGKTDTVVEPVDSIVNVISITNVAQEIEVPLPEVVPDSTMITLEEGASAVEPTQGQKETNLSNIDNGEVSFEIEDLLERERRSSKTARKESSVPSNGGHLSPPLEDSPPALTSCEIWAMLESFWQSNKLSVKFSELIPKDAYNKHDACTAFGILLEFHAQKKLVLKQTECFRTLWIEKCND